MSHTSVRRLLRQLCYILRYILRSKEWFVPQRNKTISGVKLVMEPLTWWTTPSVIALGIDFTNVILILYFLLFNVTVLYFVVPNLAKLIIFPYLFRFFYGCFSISYRFSFISVLITYVWWIKAITIREPSLGAFCVNNTSGCFQPTDITCSIKKL